MSKCESGCGKSAYFNILGNKNGRFCSTHKSDGMVNVKDKLCEHCECSGKRATFGSMNGKPTFCVTHALDGMINLSLKRCKGINGEKCYITPIYNCEGESKGIYCNEHKLANMINVTGKRCENATCNLIAQFNVEGETGGRFCSKHKLEGMIDVKHNRCEFDGCKLSPSYRFETDTHCRLCSVHRLDGMFDGKHKRCLRVGCNKIASYNAISSSKYEYCFDHKLSEMINVRHVKCLFEECKKRPLCNYLNEKTGIYCATHKKDGMVDVLSRKCNSEWCNTIVHNTKYDGYCLSCFVNLFPDKQNARNYKTKEKTVVDYILTNYPMFTWITDKKVQGGCSRRRPDLLLDLGYQVIIIEIDENQHNNYDCSCDNKRLMEISRDLGFRPIVFIRFNPDSYINKNNEKIASCWKCNKQGVMQLSNQSMNAWTQRLSSLKTQIEYWTNNKTEKTVEIIQLYYDEL